MQNKLHNNATAFDKANKVWEKNVNRKLINFRYSIIAKVINEGTL